MSQEESTPQARVFWVLLTVFGGSFTTGIAVLPGSPLWGLAWMITGIIGLLILVRDRIKAIPVRTPLLILASVMGALFIGYSSYQLTAVSRSIDMYVMPRTVTKEQAEAIRAYLAPHKAHRIAVKVNPLDREAMEYWAQLFNALRLTSWEVEQITSMEEPHTLNDGLCIHEQGTNSKQSNSKDDPATLLRDALRNAQVQVNCGGGTGAGEYKLFLLVGHRPLAVGRQPPLLESLGEWLLKVSQ